MIEISFFVSLRLLANKSRTANLTVNEHPAHFHQHFRSYALNKSNTYTSLSSSPSSSPPATTPSAGIASGGSSMPGGSGGAY